MTFAGTENNGGDAKQFKFNVKILKLATRKHKNEISEQTGLPKTPNSVLLYGNLESLLKHQENVQQILGSRLHFPQILGIYRGHKGRIFVAIESPTEQLDITKNRQEILEIYRYFHETANLPLCIASLAELWTWPLPIATQYGLIFKRTVRLLGPAPEIPHYNKMDFVPPKEALAAIDAYVLGSDMNLQSNTQCSDPRKRPSISKLYSEFAKENSGSGSFELPKYVSPIERISRAKLWSLWLQREGGLSTLLLKLGMVEDVPGVISIDETSRNRSKQILATVKEVTCTFSLTDHAFPLLMEWNLPDRDGTASTTPSKPSTPSQFSSPSMQASGQKLSQFQRTDYDHDFKQLMLFSHICNAYPITKARLLLELNAKFCPDIVRSEIWRCLLGVQNIPFNKSTPVPVDPTSFLSEQMSRQLDVDIPRCHQYNNTLASPHGQQAIKRVIARWINANSPRLTYWQGLDSLCAPFVILYISNEDIAFKAFSNFVDKVLPDMFQPDNSKVITRYLGLLEQLLNFFDPKLGHHLNEIGFIPSLYAVPWFLTMFSHVVSLKKIYVIWDRLLIKTSSQAPEAARIFPVYIAVAMLSFISYELLQYDFNQCCQWSSDMQDFDVYHVVSKAEEMFERSPLSVGSWTDSSAVGQPVPFIQLQRVQHTLAEASAKIVDHGLVLVDTRDHVRFKQLSLKHSQSIPYDDEIDFGASFIGFTQNNQTIVLVGDFDTNSKLSLQLISLHIKHVCILYEDIEQVQVQQRFKNMFNAREN